MGDYCIKCEKRREEINRDKRNEPLNIIDSKKQYYGFICYKCHVDKEGIEK